MRGEILSYDAATGGLISGDDGQRYGFTASALQSPAVPAPGVRVDFIADGADAREIVILAGAHTASAQAASAQPPHETGAGAPFPSTIAGFDWQKLMLSFDGRIRRSHFWVAWLIILGVYVVLSWIPLLNLLTIVLIWPFVAICVKRLHDMDRPGWFAAIPWGGSLVLTVVGFMMVGASIFAAGASDGYNGNPAAFLALMGPGIGAFVLASLIWIGFILWIGLVEGQPGANRFGPNPKGL